MAILPVGAWGGQGSGRNRQPMNYATGTPTGTSSGGQTQNPTQSVTPQINMGFGVPRWANANPGTVPAYRMPQAYMMGINANPQPLPMRFQQGGMNPMANQLAGQMGNVQVPNGMNIQNFAGRMGGMQGGQMGGFGINPNMLVQMRRGILPKFATEAGGYRDPNKVYAY